MEIVEQFRNAIVRLVEETAGQRMYWRNNKLSDKEIQSIKSHIFTLPTLTFTDIQFMSGPNFGKFKYMAGYDPLGDADYPLGGP